MKMVTTIQRGNLPEVVSVYPIAEKPTDMEIRGLWSQSFDDTWNMIKADTTVTSVKMEIKEHE